MTRVAELHGVRIALDRAGRPQDILAHSGLVRIVALRATRCGHSGRHMRIRGECRHRRHCCNHDKAHKYREEEPASMAAMQGAATHETGPPTPWYVRI